MAKWNSAETIPRRKGWYRVRRLDRERGDLPMFRPFGNGGWWTPLIDGWLGRMEPRGIYEWQDGPICKMEPSSSTMTPLEEMTRARMRYMDQQRATPVNNKA